MTGEDGSDNVKTGMVPEVANLGIVRPPLVYLGAIALDYLPYKASVRRWL
jgi:hypothetical protein